MAITVTTNAADNDNTPTGENGANFHYQGAFSTENAGYLVDYGFEGSLYALVGSEYIQSRTYTKYWTNQPSDTTFSINAWAHRYTGPGEDGAGANIDLKTNAVAPASSNPQATNVVQDAATISMDFNRKTHESSATTWLEYKKSSDPGWTQAGAVDVGSGFGTLNISRNLSGLSPGTQYDYRLRMTRDTNNDTNYTSSVYNFTTLYNESFYMEHM